MNGKNEIKAIIFDLDGTLLDTLQDLFLATNHALRTHGMPERTLDEIRQFVGNGVRKLIERATPEGEANPRFNDIFAEFKRYYVLHCHDNTCLYPGIAEMLKALKERGISLAIVSNKLQAGVTELHQRWFTDTMSVAIGERENVRRKPAPDMVELAIESLDIKRESVVYVGDSEVDIQTATNAHIPCLSVLWGFRSREFLEAHGATTFITHPSDILSRI